MTIILRDVELDGRRTADVAIAADGRISAVGSLRPGPGDTVVDGGGGALLPGLADHHVHLMALGAALGSVDCGPPRLRSADDLARALAGRAADVAPGTWVRGIGYHESVAGPLDRERLDAMVGRRPVRLQHRGGALWMVNSAGARLLGLDDPDRVLPTGVERDPEGRPTGRLWRLDGWMRERLGPPELPDLAEVGRRLASYGVTAVTDATPDLPENTARELARSAGDGRLPQRLTLLGTADGPRPGETWTPGPRKLQPSDHDLWPYDELLDRIRAARADRRRPVAVHCVTRESLVLTLVALQEAGAVPGDRIEHAAVVPPDLLPVMRDLGVRVVTQPVFVAERGDTYLAEVDPEDVPHLYPYASLLAAGIPVTASSDAPYGGLDPWAGVRAARDRRTRSGRILGPAERMDAATVLRGLLSRPSVAVGAPADLCLLRVPWREGVRSPDAELVRMTFCRGAVAYDAEA
ncbi:amidohydrolase family protein [Streptomyces sp. SID4956]|uniref:amidohydrolase family protein n=1 Tax=Streptomyces sp. SID4956 TaxID=2690290 RepID=UPI00137007A3|nr:amidohydrolase family protein [Streptomyces sp. SID4956]